MKSAIFGSVIVSILLGAPLALAGVSPTRKVYGGTAGNVQTQVQQGAVSHSSAGKGAGTLPFTGLNLAFIAAGAVLLVAFGLTLRRMSHRSTD